MLKLIKVLVERIDEHDSSSQVLDQRKLSGTVKCRVWNKPLLSSSIQAYAFEGVFSETVIKIGQFLDHSFTIIVSVHLSSVKMLLQQL